MLRSRRLRGQGRLGSIPAGETCDGSTALSWEQRSKASAPRDAVSPFLGARLRHPRRKRPWIECLGPPSARRRDLDLDGNWITASGDGPTNEELSCLDGGGSNGLNLCSTLSNGGPDRSGGRGEIFSGVRDDPGSELCPHSIRSSRA